MNILLVEDDKRVCDFLASALGVEGHQVTASRSAEAALQALAQSFDVAIIDVTLPGMSGTALCRQMRAAGDLTPVLMLTALDAVEDKVSGLRAGADDYLTKPFNFDELLARLDAVTRRGRGAADDRSQILLCGTIALDRVTHETRLDGQEIVLTAKEFKLLELLMENEGNLLSRSHILKCVWGYDTDPLTNVVDVYIRRLRTKLGMDAETGAIRSIRGYGYRLVPAE